VLIEALGLLGTGAAAHLVIAGGESFAGSQARIGGYTEQLRALAQRAGLADRVHFLGHRADTEALMAQFDVVVVPSVALESAPRVTAEAQAAGRAVIGSDIGGMAEMIEPGVTGLLVPPGDPQALVAALRGLLHDASARARLGTGARAHATAEYSLLRFGQRITAICEQLITPASPDRPKKPT
jgi:glycosyltransferase involved in cell wall biosynthesis